MLVTLSTYVLGMYDTGMVNNHPFEHSSILVMRAMQDGLALLPGFSTAICDQKAGKELGNKAKTGNQNYLRACIHHEEYAIYTNSLFLLLV